MMIIKLYLINKIIEKYKNIFLILIKKLSFKINKLKKLN